jgi:NAD(P)-dependent dehydrogenase (short-subunit alcohol dehydrogenase family)
MRLPARAPRLRAGMSGFEVRGKTVFVTGAARGIGAATAARMHARGANVALVGLEPERLQANAELLGERAAAFEADVTDMAALEAAVSATVERFGGIDVAVANAGIAFTGTLSTAPVEQVERTLAVNLLGVWRTDRAVVGELRRSRGYLLNVASLAAITHAPMMGPYTSAKAGVEALTDSLRLELAPLGVGVGCAYFGFLDTDLVKASFAQPSTEAMQQRMPGFMRNPAPLEKAIDAIERGIRRRSARVWSPRWVGPMIPLRGLLQPLIERQALRDMQTLRENVAFAESCGEAESMDPLLGVSAAALPEREPGQAMPRA